MKNTENTNEQQWKLLVLLLREIAIQKHGIGWQTWISENTPFAQSNISRMFGLKYTPSLNNLLIIAKALNVNFFFEDKESKADLNIAFENAMEQLETLKKRLYKIGIDVEFVANFPWIYLYKINGQLVKERHEAEHGFTIAFLPVRRDKLFHFTDLSVIFKLIRKYCI